MNAGQHSAEKDYTEPTELLTIVTDVDGVAWTRYHTDPTGKGRHWWTSPWVADNGDWCGGWRAFTDLRLPPGQCTDEDRA